MRRSTGVAANGLSAGIDKSKLAIGAPRRYRNREHLRYVAKQPCLVCGRKPSDPHHLRFAQPRALGRKASDEFAVPLCRIHHRLVHRVGNEGAWWQEVGIDPIKAAGKLWKRTRLDHPKPNSAKGPIGSDEGEAPGRTPEPGRGEPAIRHIGIAMLIDPSVRVDLFHTPTGTAFADDLNQWASRDLADPQRALSRLAAAPVLRGDGECRERRLREFDPQLARDAGAIRWPRARGARPRRRARRPHLS